MAKACLLARHRLAQTVDGLNKGGVGAKIEAGTSAVKAMYVGGLVTPLKGVLGNASMAGYRMLAQMPIQAGTDYLMAIGRAVREGKPLASAKEYRTVIALNPLESLTVYGRGFKRGGKEILDAYVDSHKRAKSLMQPGSGFGGYIAEFMDELKVQLKTRGESLSPDNTKVFKFKHPVARLLGEGAFALVESVDRPAFEGAYEASMYMQAKLMAYKLGKEGAEADAYIRGELANPNPEMEARALADAQYSTFKDSTQMAESANMMAQQFKNAIQEGGDKRLAAAVGAIIMGLKVPFTGVPSSVLAKSLDATPIGFANAVGKAAYGYSNDAVSRSLAGGLVGTGGIALGYWLYKNNYIVPSPPTDPNARADERDASRRLPSSVLIPGTNIRFDLKMLAPASVSLLIGAELAREKQQDGLPTVSETVGATLAGVGKMTVDQSYLQGVKQTIDAVQEPTKKGEALLASMVPTPSLGGQIARAMDPKERDANSTLERIAVRTPFRMMLPERQSPLGDMQDKTALERISAVASPVQLMQDRETPELAELRRLGVNIGMPERKITRNGKRFEIPDDLYRAQVRRQGEGMTAMINRIMMDPRYPGLTDEDKKATLKAAIENKQRQARGPTYAEIDLLLRDKKRD